MLDMDTVGYFLYMEQQEEEEQRKRQVLDAMELDPESDTAGQPQSLDKTL